MDTLSQSAVLVDAAPQPCALLNVKGRTFFLHTGFRLQLLSERTTDCSDPRVKRNMRTAISLDILKKPAGVASQLSMLDIGVRRMLASTCMRTMTTSGDLWEVETLCKEGGLNKAWTVLLSMDEQGLIPSLQMYKSLLRACSKEKALTEAKRIHAHLAERGLELNRSLGELVVATLVNCGSLDDGIQLFKKLPHRSAFAWTAIISGYSNAGLCQKALSLYDEMQKEGVQPDNYTFVSLLKACSRLEDLEQGRRIHAEAVAFGFGSDVFVGSTLVSMYARCGSICDAQQVFVGLSQRNIVSWNAMIAGYVQQDQGEKALQTFRQMQEARVRPNARTFVSTLQACGILAEKDGTPTGGVQKVRALHTGRELHAEAANMGFEQDSFVGNTLVSMYAKCGSISDAEEVFEKLSQHDVVSWNALITAYAEQDQGGKALQLFSRMQAAGFQPGVRTFVGALQACGRLADKEEPAVIQGREVKVECLEKGRQIHAAISRGGLELDTFVSCTLVNMYAKCGSIEHAEQVFDRLSVHNVMLYTAMISAYAQHDQQEKGLQMFWQMQEEGIRPDTRALVSALQTCGSLAEKEENADVDGHEVKVESLWQGRKIHTAATEAGLDLDKFVASSLVCMYSKTGSIRSAKHVFDNLHHRDLVSWNAMLSVYAQHDQGEKALQLYQQMQEEGVKPDARSFVSALQACARLADKEESSLVDGQAVKVEALQNGKQIHSVVSRTSFKAASFVGNTLVSMYSKCGSMKDAEQTFDRLDHSDVVSWNAMLAAYAQHGKGERGLRDFWNMLQHGVSPDARTFVSALQACGSLAEQEESILIDVTGVKVESLWMTRGVHHEAVQRGFGSDMFVSNTLVTVYSKCGSINDAEEVFNNLSQRSLVSWSALITGYVQQDQAEKGLRLYKQMQKEGLRPDAQAFVSALQGCGKAAEKEEGVVVDGEIVKVESLRWVRELHSGAILSGLELDGFVGSTLLGLYVKCGSISDAENVFDRLPQRGAMAWNILTAAYAEQEQGDRAMQLYAQMQAEGVKPDAGTFRSVLKACSSIGSLDACVHIHQGIKDSLLECNLLVSSSLVNAYSRCGSMVDAQLVFDTIFEPDVVSWTTLIAGYARSGDIEMTIRSYENMCLAGVKPDGVTFLALLSACSHTGMVEKGLEYFESMRRDYDVSVHMEHYSCVIDLLLRAGLLCKSEELFAQMPMQPTLPMWLSLLSACLKYGNVAQGKRAFQAAVRVDPRHAAAYVLMSNIFLDAGMWDCSKEVHALRHSAGAWKEPGQTWIQHEQKVHRFVMNPDVRHDEQTSLHAVLKDLNAKLKA